MTTWQEEKNAVTKALFNELKALTKEKVTLEKKDELLRVRLTTDYPIYVRPKGYDNRYSFTLSNQLPFIGSGDFGTKVEKAPNKVGVLSAKKISDWVEYLSKGHDVLVKESAIRGAKVDAFLVRINKIKGVRFGDDSMSGEIIRNGLVLKFEISNCGYISQKIKVRYTIENNLDSFLKLSKNKLT